MKKNTFKTVIKREDTLVIKEVEGYFTWLGNIRFFIYKDLLYNKWYVIDLDTGMALEDGYSMSDAKKNTFESLARFNEFKETEKYKQYRFMYQKLLKDDKEKRV